jgi:Icc-related predicted phosphoesterase
MRLYAAADLHGKRRHFDIVKEGLRQSGADAVVLAGDILNYGRGRPLLPILERLSRPVFVVRGNSDPSYLDRWAAASRNVHALHLNAVPFNGIELVGISGTLPIPFHSRAGWREAEGLKRLSGLTHSGAILVAHPPPYGCCDQVLGHFSAGSRGLARLVRESKPAVMLCGHIHEAAGTAFCHNTLVVNCALGSDRRGAVVVLEKGRPPYAEML